MLVPKINIQVSYKAWQGYIGLNVQEKVKTCSDRLEGWGKEITGDFSGRIRRYKAVLKRSRGGRDAELKKEYAEAKKNWFLY